MMGVDVSVQVGVKIRNRFFDSRRRSSLKLRNLAESQRRRGNAHLNGKIAGVVAEYRPLFSLWMTILLAEPDCVILRVCKSPEQSSVGETETKRILDTRQHSPPQELSRI